MRKLGWLVVLAASCSKDKAPEAQPEPAASAWKARPADKGTDRHQPVIPDAPPLKLAVSVKGVTSVWEQAAFDKVPRYTKGTDGSLRDVWSLRELAHVLVGPTAHVVSVTGVDGSKSIDSQGWDDAAHTPILHTTRRGTLKFTWTDAAGKWGESEVKDVTKLEIEL